jgi:hypothetical protein
MIATICSSENRPFRIAPSESGASLSTYRWSENLRAGHRSGSKSGKARPSECFDSICQERTSRCVMNSDATRTDSGEASLPSRRLPTDRLMMPDRDQRWSVQVDREYFEQHVHHWCVGLVEDSVVYVTGFEEEIARAVNHGLIRQDVSHVAGGDLANAGALMIVLADISTGGQCQLGDAKLVLSVDLLEEPLERRLELDLCDQAFGIDLDRAYAHLRARFVRVREQRHERHRCKGLKNVASVRHDGSPVAWDN